MKTMVFLMVMALALPLAAQRDGSHGRPHDGFKKGNMDCNGPGFDKPGKPLGPKALRIDPDQLKEKDREAFATMEKELRKSMKELHNELHLKKAEMKYLLKRENPVLADIEKKMDEVMLLEKKIRLEHIKFDLKVQKAFPYLEDDDLPGEE